MRQAKFKKFCKGEVRMKKPLTPSTMGKRRWKGVPKEDRSAHGKMAVAAREAKRAGKAAEKEKLDG